MYYSNGKYLIPREHNHNLGKRQENNIFHIRNGAIYITKTNYFLKYNSLICTKPIGYEMDKISSINIDEQIDLEIAKASMKIGILEPDNFSTQGINRLSKIGYNFI